MIHHIPHKCTKGLGLFDQMSPKQAYYYRQSLNRYRQRAEYMSYKECLNALNCSPFKTEITQIEAFRMVNDIMRRNLLDAAELTSIGCGYVSGNLD